MRRFCGTWVVFSHRYGMSYEAIRNCIRKCPELEKIMLRFRNLRKADSDEANYVIIVMLLVNY